MGNPHNIPHHINTSSSACMQALGAVLGVLDCAGSCVGALKHPCAAAPPHCWVVHLPAHYEIIYPRVPTDALDGVPVPLQ